MEKSRSIIQVFGIPDSFGLIILLFTFILCIATYFPGSDFGIFKIPWFNLAFRRRLRWIAPILFLFGIGLHIHIFPAHHLPGEKILKSQKPFVEMPPVQDEAELDKSARDTARNLDLDNERVFVDGPSNLDWTFPSIEPCTWNEANEHARNISIRGRKGWRLPTVEEVKALLNVGFLEEKNIEKGFFWTDSTDGDLVKIIDLNNGVFEKTRKSSINFIILVRNVANENQGSEKIDYIQKSF